jgi:8-oxo-dGTP pyrophosphatase MutT (NUDIX family)
MILKMVIHNYRHYWGAPEEGADLLRQIAAGEDVLSRANWNGHVTASALVFSPDFCRVLMIDAVKFGKLLLPGGHLEPSEDVSDAARRELMEETGLSSVRPLKFFGQTLPVEISTHWIESNERRAEPRHRHHDFIYPFIVVREQARIFKSSLEAKSVGWHSVSELYMSYPRASQRILISKERLI